jgi:hypothetical protein
MVTKGKVIKTECIEARIKKDFKISVHVESKGLDCFEGSPDIREILNADGMIVVHSCSEVFIRTSNIEKIEIYTDDLTKEKYTRIIFQKVE